MNGIAVVGIAGPGDAFASPEEALETLRFVRAEYSEMLLCVATNGLNLPPYIDELAALNVSHVTITMNAVDPAIGSKVYAWVRDGKKIYRKEAAARILLERQLESIRLLKEIGILVKINSILIPCVNEDHIQDIAETVSDLGADILNCIPLYSVEGTPFESIPAPTDLEVKRARGEAEVYLPQMRHCTRCRADAVGLLGELLVEETAQCLRESSALPLDPNEDRPYTAATSLEGLLVNQHLWEASQVLIFAQRGTEYDLIETRPTPPPGGGDQRWKELANRLHDCRALLAHSAGDSPRRVLTSAGVRVILMEGLIEEGLEAVYRNTEIRSPLREHRCGSGCAGTGTGCN